jgi:hypothetical protein
MEYISIGNNFLNRTLIAQDLRERINKWNCIELKCFFCMAKETASRLKRLPTEWKKIFVT